MTEIINSASSYADAFDDFVKNKGYRERDLGRQPGDPIATEDPTVPIYVPETPSRVVPERLKHPLDRTFPRPRRENDY